jgi:energy-coupling factor transporter ATP-binding protein EcfA2
MASSKLPHAYVVPPGTVIITGPQGCGKSQFGAALARFYGKRRVIDDWMLGDKVPEDAIALTSETHLINAISFRNAMRAAGLSTKGVA